MKPKQYTESDDGRQPSPVQSSLFLKCKDRIIDRTNWFWGKTKINVFMCSIAYEGIAIPILWTLLPKAGTSSAYEQISLVKRFIQLFGSHCIQGLLAEAGLIDDLYLISVLHQFRAMKMFAFFERNQGLELANSIAAGY